MRCLSKYNWLLIPGLLLCVSASAQLPQLPTNAWAGTDKHTLVRTDPAELGIDRQSFEPVIRMAEDNNSDALLILYNGQVVFEQCWNGKGSDDVQQMYSATKSPFSLLVGRAIQKGYIQSLDQKIVDLVPEIAGSGRESLSFRNIMAMESGLEQSRAMDQADIQAQRTQLESVLNRSVTASEFSWFHYNNAAYRLLFTALERASEKSIPQLSKEELFEPLGMVGAYWMEFRREGESAGYQSIRMRPQDMAKVGQVILNGGVWGDEQYLPKSFIEQLLIAPAPEVNPSYGLFWHLNGGDFYRSYAENDKMQGELIPAAPDDAVANYGSGGQVIVVVPSLELVWVRTGGRSSSTIWQPDSFTAQMSRLMSQMSRLIVTAVKEPLTD